ncbi:MAG: HAD-IA family hydrolase [Chloroflexi bacterium]|nr:HAD-IA family hydrolase [Chloroflexota bacterium]
MSNSRPPPRIRAVVFDLDDVLLDYDYRMRTRMRGAYERAARGLPDHLRRRAADGTIAFIRDLMARHAWEEAEQADWFIKPLADLGIVDGELVAALCDDIDAHFDTANRLHPDAPRMLGATDGMPRCIITNGHSRIQRPKLSQLGLDDGRFDEIFVSHEHGIWKPDPRIFKLALAVTGSSPAETLMIGDNPYTDIAGANASGMLSLWINHGGISLPEDGPEPTWEVGGIKEAAELLEALLEHRRVPVRNPG